MSSQITFWTMLASMVIMTISGAAQQVVHEISWHDLEEYCNRKRRNKTFSRIIDLRDEMALGTLMVQMIATAISICCLVFLMLEDRVPMTLEGGSLWVIIGVSAAALTFLNSWLPWAIAQAAAEPFLFHTWRIWWVVAGMAWPLTVGAKVLSNFFFRARGKSIEDEDEEEAFEDEILSMVSEGEHDGLLEPARADMIEGVMELDDYDVGRVMTPRSRVDAMEFSTGWDEMLEFIVNSGRTRIPIYRDTIDNIIGILYAKDMLGESLRSESKRRSLERLVREPIKVPESTLLREMLQQFQVSRVHMAIVEDEYKGVAGVVTIEDILEEIVGDIVDETDNEELNEFRKIDDNSAEVLGTTHLKQLNEELGLQLPEDEEFDTVSGLIMSQLKEVPRMGRELVFNNVRFRVEKANRRFIELVRVERVAAEDEEPV
ncbi:MAG: hemolysin family protein [Mariniblastus sp.]|nr:hemolysin family protein [Mariniblastus sp.]